MQGAGRSASSGRVPGPPRGTPGEQVGVAVVVGELVEERARLEHEGGQCHARQVHAWPQLFQQDPHQALILLLQVLREPLQAFYLHHASVQFL